MFFCVCFVHQGITIDQQAMMFLCMELWIRTVQILALKQRSQKEFFKTILKLNTYNRFPEDFWQVDTNQRAP